MWHANRVAGGAFLLGVIVLAASQPARGQCQATELAKLVAADPATSHVFGGSAVIEGSTAIIGAWTDDDHGVSSGSAYVFHYDGVQWIRQQKLLTDGGEPFDYYGDSVGLSGDLAIVGARGEDDDGGNSGAAYVYRYDGQSWVQEARLRPADAHANQQFGNAVAVYGDIAVVGAWTDDAPGLASGSAYVFGFDGFQWIEQVKLVAADGAAGHWFGYSVAISGPTILIGAPYDDDHGPRSGSAYVFYYDGSSWVQQAKLVPADGAAEDWFGFSVALDTDLAVIGACRYDGLSRDSGAAYVFGRSGSAWTLEQKLLASDGAEDDNFGFSVAVSGDLAVVGAVLNDADGLESGSGYVFRRQGGNWPQEAKLRASDGRDYNYLGCCAAVHGDTAVLGAWADDGQGNPTGLGYVFGSLADCNTNGALDICDVTGGTSPDANRNGIPDECEIVPGDMNCDGQVDVGDINPFVLALAKPAVYQATYPHCLLANADINQDGLIDFGDINPFVVLLGR
jgi:hypothetical protein